MVLPLAFGLLLEVLLSLSDIVCAEAKEMTFNALLARFKIVVPAKCRLNLIVQ